MALAAVLLLALLGGGWLWLRDSSLVSVEHVTVSGDSGPDAAQIRSALVSAARTMSTLDVHLDRLRTAVAPYPVVRDVRVSTDFPHGLRIHVIEQIAVATLVVGGQTVPVAADGTLLHDAGPTPALPMLQVRSAPGGPRLTEPDAMSEVALLAAAPYPLLARISQVSHDGAHGLTAQLRNGPAIYFGDASQAGGEVARGRGRARRSGLRRRELHRRHRSAASGRRLPAARGGGRGARRWRERRRRVAAGSASRAARAPRAPTSSGQLRGAPRAARALPALRDRRLRDRRLRHQRVGTAGGTAGGTTAADRRDRHQRPLTLYFSFTLRKAEPFGGCREFGVLQRALRAGRNR